MEKFDKKKSIFTYEDKYTYEYFVFSDPEK